MSVSLIATLHLISQWLPIECHGFNFHSCHCPCTYHGNQATIVVLCNWPGDVSQLRAIWYLVSNLTKLRDPFVSNWMCQHLIIRYRDESVLINKLIHLSSLRLIFPSLLCRLHLNATVYLTHLWHLRVRLSKFRALQNTELSSCYYSFNWIATAQISCLFHKTLG